jgi:hypothetical protein
MTPAPPQAQGVAPSALADLAIASGCSAKTFAGIFGPVVDLSIYRGWQKSMYRGEWRATKGKTTLRAATLGGIHAKIDARFKLPRRSPQRIAQPPVAVGARGDGKRVGWDADAGRFVWAASDLRAECDAADSGVMFEVRS